MVKRGQLDLRKNQDRSVKQEIHLKRNYTETKIVMKQKYIFFYVINKTVLHILKGKVEAAIESMSFGLSDDMKMEQLYKGLI